ncbi:hypothetical protein SDC9_170882 [bioreactor metagenome]|uniref:Uncharacterized protein n=1 Tax=bioreactor metagenome TaxID=1076179 RepID=A0A645GI15_9ZZZZ
MLTAAPLYLLIRLTNVDFLSAEDIAAFSADNVAAECITVLVFSRIINAHLLSAVFINFFDRFKLFSGDNRFMVF